MISAAYLVRRMMHTKRWGIINTTRQQTVSEHTCGVMVLADRLATDQGLPESQHLQLLRHCLYHDSFEVLSGDFPGSIKRNDPNLKAALDAVEERCTDIPSVAVPDNLKQMAKAADLAESVIYLEDAGSGLRAAAVVRALRKLIKPYFSHILDESNKLEDDKDLDNH